MTSPALAPAFGSVAFLYAMVGHGGASGYLALGALLGEPLVALRGQALILNLGVAGLSALFFTRARWMRWDLLGSLALGSVPMAFWTAHWKLSSTWACGLLAAALASAAGRLWWDQSLKAHVAAGAITRPRWATLTATGALLGALAGLTGVGGGIYLSPLLLLCRWADVKETATLSAAFITLNSLAGLAGLAQGGALPSVPTDWFFATLFGGALGAVVGAEWMPKRRLAQALASALLLAAWKLGAKALG